MSLAWLKEKGDTGLTSHASRCLVVVKQSVIGDRVPRPALAYRPSGSMGADRSVAAGYRIAHAFSRLSLADLSPCGSPSQAPENKSWRTVISRLLPLGPVIGACWVRIPLPGP